MPAKQPQQNASTSAINQLQSAATTVENAASSEGLAAETAIEKSKAAVGLAAARVNAPAAPATDAADTLAPATDAADTTALATAATATARDFSLAERANSSQISDFCIGDFAPESPFIRPASARYKIAQTPMRWDFIRAHDAVSVFVRHGRAFVFVRQFRAPLAAYFGAISRGYSVELCSGLCDKPATAEQIAREECAEELGLRAQNLEFWGEFFHGFGSGCACTRLYFASAQDADFAQFDPAACERSLAANGYYIDEFAGGVDAGERTERLWIAQDAFEGFFAQHPRSALIEYAYLKFINQIAR